LALLATPAIVLAGPISSLPDVRGPDASPPPRAQAQPQVTAAQQPYDFTGPTGRVLLGGTWGYRGDPGDHGLARGWQRGSFSSRHVHIPYVANAWPVTGRRGLRNFEGSVGWFVKHFRVAKPGRYAIRFESVHHRARVWVDGKQVAAHIGAYMPFEAHPVLQ